MLWDEGCIMTLHEGACIRELHMGRKMYPLARPLASTPNVLSVTTYVKRDTMRWLMILMRLQQKLRRSGNA